jgi:hypothetical protein
MRALSIFILIAYSVGGASKRSFSLSNLRKPLSNVTRVCPAEEANAAK